MDEVCTNQRRKLARRLYNTSRGYDPNTSNDSRVRLETLGIIVHGLTKDQLYYDVEIPNSWVTSTIGGWTTFKDDQGEPRLMQFEGNGLESQNYLVFLD